MSVLKFKPGSCEAVPCKPELTSQDLKNASMILMQVNRLSNRLGRVNSGDAWYAANRAWKAMGECVKLIKESL